MPLNDVLSESTLKLPIASDASSQNKKLEDSGIVWCPEIEGAAPCKFFAGANLTESPLCPGCYARGWYPMRASRYSDAQNTPLTGLIRLGTWREVTATDYQAFRQGHGTTPAGRTWERPDFPTRRHFVITRGLEDWSLYQDMAANPHCLNIQVSVDILVTGKGVQQVPRDDRLQQFLQIPKAIFRFKSLAEPANDRGTTFQANVDHFLDLSRRLGIPRIRVLETPLRLGGNRAYQTTTPLEQTGWEPESFLRCNSECHDCPGADGQGENRVLVCGATTRTLEILAAQGNIRPKRIEAGARQRIGWTELTLRAWARLGGLANLQDLYRAVIKLDPRVAKKMHYQAKIRAIVQAHGQREGRAVWRLVSKPLVVSSSPVAVEA